MVRSDEKIGGKLILTYQCSVSQAKAGGRWRRGQSLCHRGVGARRSCVPFGERRRRPTVELRRIVRAIGGVSKNPNRNPHAIRLVAFFDPSFRRESIDTSKGEVVNILSLRGPYRGKRVATTAKREGESASADLASQSEQRRQKMRETRKTTKRRVRAKDACSFG